MSAKSVVFVHRFGPKMASYRYRAQIPAEEVGKINGFRTAVNNGDAEIAVYSKPNADDLERARDAKAQGVKIIADLGDDHFTTDPVYMDMAQLADALVCPTQAMRARIYDYTKKDCAVIPDPYEQPECAPHADGGNFLWFGHSVNIRDIIDTAHLLKGRTLRVVSGPKTPPTAIPWSPENMRIEFERANIAVFPTRAGSENKSPNRLLNAIRAGLFPVCMKHPAYMEFRPFAWVGNLPTGLKWIDAFRGDLNDRVSAAQDYIRDRYSPATVGAQWAAFLEGV